MQTPKPNLSRYYFYLKVVNSNISDCKTMHDPTRTKRSQFIELA